MKKKLKPVNVGSSRFYRIEVRPEYSLSSTGTQGVGRGGAQEPVLDRNSSGNRDAILWLISKEDAEPSGNRLVITNKKVKKTLNEEIVGPIKKVRTDIFHAYPRPHTRTTPKVRNSNKS